MVIENVVRACVVIILIIIAIAVMGMDAERIQLKADLAGNTTMLEQCQIDNAVMQGNLTNTTQDLHEARATAGWLLYTLKEVYGHEI